MRYLIKVDTNGTFPEAISRFNNLGLVDFWAMDVKNSEEEYCKTAGIAFSGKLMRSIKKSINFILNSGVDYEFRTTVVPGLHTKDSIEGVGKLINGAKHLALQNFHRGKCLDNKFSSLYGFSNEELLVFKKIMKRYAKKVVVRD